MRRDEFLKFLNRFIERKTLGLEHADLLAQVRVWHSLTVKFYVNMLFVMKSHGERVRFLKRENRRKRRNPSYLMKCAYFRI